MFYKIFLVFGIFSDTLMINGEIEPTDMSECLHIDVSITQNIVHDGFHRDVKWLVELLSPSKETWQRFECKLVLQVDVPPGIFVNPDQMADLKRSKKLDAQIQGKVNVEVPLHEATSHIVNIYLNNTEIEKTLITLPIHLRYQRAQIGGGFSKVVLPTPAILVFCPMSTVCGKGNEVLISMDSSDTSVLKPWKNVTYQTVFQNAELFVPIGDLDHYPMVSIITLLLGCTGCLYILSVLKISSF